MSRRNENEWVSIPNPDDPMGMPIYEGDPDKAWEVIVPGFYHNVTWDANGDGDEMTVSVIVIGPEGPWIPSLDVMPSERRCSFVFQHGCCPMGCPIDTVHDHTTQELVGYDDERVAQFVAHLENQ